MDSVRALLVLLPDAPDPDPALATQADAIVFVAPDQADQFAGAAERIPALLALGPPLYLAVPLLGSGLVRDYLRLALQPGVYGVASRPPTSVEQLRYLESLLEDVELRAGIRPGLTAMAVGFEHPRALNFMSEALGALRGGADRMTWIAFDHAALAESLGVQADSATVAQAGLQAVLTAAAFDFPVVSGSPAEAEAHAALGFRGCATDDPSDLERLRSIFNRPEPDAHSDANKDEE